MRLYRPCLPYPQDNDMKETPPDLPLNINRHTALFHDEYEIEITGALIRD